MKRFLLGLLLASPMLTFAQANFQKGYVVINPKDTLKGFIDYKERKRNPISFSFRPTMSSSTQTFTLKNCVAYGIDHEESFVRFLVDISTSEINIDNLSEQLDLSSRRDTVFLKVLQSGKNVTLFSYTDKLKDRFYLMESGKLEPAELVRQVYMNNDGVKRIVNDNKYIDQLIAATGQFNKDTPIDEQKFSRLEYNEESLLPIVAEINQQKLEKPKRKSSRFFAGVGLNVSRVSYGGLHDLASSSAKVKTSYLPALTAGVDLFLNPAIGKFLFRTELSLQMSNNEISVAVGNEQVSHSFDQFIAVVTPQMIYNIHNTDRLKYFVGVGGGLNFLLSRNNKYVYTNTLKSESTTIEDPLKLETFNFSFQGVIGVVLNKKIEISATYSPDMPVSYYGVFGIYTERFRLGLNYLFGK